MEVLCNVVEEGIGVFCTVIEVGGIGVFVMLEIEEKLCALSAIKGSLDVRYVISASAGILNVLYVSEGKSDVKGRGVEGFADFAESVNV
jgi:hypothetical protein